MGGKHYSLIDEEEKEEGDEDVYMYPADMHPYERDEYREAIHGLPGLYQIRHHGLPLFQVG